MTAIDLDQVAVVTVDELALVMRWDDVQQRSRRARVFDLVRSGRIVPIGGVPAQMSKHMRFAAADVRSLIEGAPRAVLTGLRSERGAA